MRLDITCSYSHKLIIYEQMFQKPFNKGIIMSNCGQFYMRMIYQYLCAGLFHALKKVPFALGFEQ